MITVHITGFLTEFAGGLRQVRLDGTPATVGAALDELWQAHLGLRDRVLDEQGAVRQHVNVFLNSDNVRRRELLATSVADGDEITILPSVSGG
jgi:sulfur-carrier protein